MPDVFQILADPTRRRIVDALRDGERSVSELVQVVDIGQPGVSRQLQILEDADFVVVRPDGRRRMYALRPDRFRELSEWVTGYRAIWESRLDRLAAELDRREKKRTGSKEKRPWRRPLFRLRSGPASCSTTGAKKPSSS